jgi:hypothetical protein
MTRTTPQKDPENRKEHAGDLPADISRGAIYSYYRDGMENVGGLKVKWTVRVVDGPEAAQVDAHQAEAIREALEWIRRHPRP